MCVLLKPEVLASFVLFLHLIPVFPTHLLTLMASTVQPSLAPNETNWKVCSHLNNFPFCIKLFDPRKKKEMKKFSSQSEDGEVAGLH